MITDCRAFVTSAGGRRIAGIFCGGVDSFPRPRTFWVEEADEQPHRPG
jgi:hypothetical protein